MSGFVMGETVTWWSSASGSRTQKTGQIVAVVPAKGRPDRRFEIGSTGLAREHESYVVAVKVGKTDKAKLRHYWPRVPNRATRSAAHLELRDAGRPSKTPASAGREQFEGRLAVEHDSNEHAQEYRAALALIDAHAAIWSPATVTEPQAEAVAEE